MLKFELHLRASNLRVLQSRLLRGLECFTNGILLVDTCTSAWPVLHANEAWAEQTGVLRVWSA